MRKDPLDIERGEILGMIEELERLYAGLQDVEAGVSDHRLEELRRLRESVLKARSPSKLNWLAMVVDGILKAAAAEMIKRLFGTFNYLLAAFTSRRSSYDDWRVNKIPASFRRTTAA
jgi:hypothetical protein